MVYRKSLASQSGLEVVPAGLEVPQSTFPEVSQSWPEVRPQHYEKYSAETTSHSSKSDKIETTQNARLSRRNRRWCWLAMGISIALILTVVIVVPLLLKQRASSANVGPAAAPTTFVSTATPSATAVPTAYKSTSGAYNGTGLTILGTINEANKYRLVYQNASGQFRQAILGSTWQDGGDASTIATNDAKNGTPIAGSSYPLADNPVYHLFYVDNNQTLRDVLSKDSGGSWSEGSLGSSNFKMLESQHAQLTFMWADDWAKGASDGSIGPNGGLKLYWSGDDRQFHEASLPYGSNTWNKTWDFGSDFDPESGIDVTVWNSRDMLYTTNNKTSTLTYAMIEHNLNGTNSTDKPLGIWSHGTPSPVIASKGSDISYGMNSAIYYQNEQNSVVGIFVNGTLGQDIMQAQFAIGNNNAIPGTRIKSTDVVEGGTSPTIKVYFQEVGNGISEWVRGRDGGSWSKNDIPVGK